MKNFWHGRAFLIVLIILIHIVTSGQLCLLKSYPPTKPNKIENEACPFKTKNNDPFCCQGASQKNKKNQPSTNGACPFQDVTFCPVEHNKANSRSSVSWRILTVNSILNTRLFKIPQGNNQISQIIKPKFSNTFYQTKPLDIPFRI